MVHAPRNYTLPGGIERYSRSEMYAKKSLWKVKKAVAPKPAAAADPATATKTVEVKGAKNGKTRTVPVQKPSKFYPAEDVKTPKASRKHPKPAKMRASVTPGTVVVLLAGRYRGKRVVVLKQLPSGLLLVSGPHCINGVPLRRVNQAYVLGTSTKVDISAVKLPESVTDAFFKKAAEKKTAKPTEAGLFKDEAKKEPISADRVSAQKSVDASLLAAIKKVPQLKSYLNATFSLTKGQAPHTMKF